MSEYSIRQKQKKAGSHFHMQLHCGQHLPRPTSSRRNGNPCQTTGPVAVPTKMVIFNWPKLFHRNNFLHILISLWTRRPEQVSFNPFRLSYVYIRTKFPNCTYIYVHGLCDRNMRLLIDTLRYHHTVHTRCSRASGLQPAAIFQHVYQRKKSGVYSELSAVFGKFWKITIVGPSSIHRLVWNTMAHYMDFLP